MFELMLPMMVWLSIALIFYHHLVYPVILKWVAKQQKDTSTSEIKNRAYQARYDDNNLPSITLLIPAHNEQRWITEKICNCAVLDYPKHKLQIIIACDGCTDSTVSLAEQTLKQPCCKNLNVTLSIFKQNRGKIAVINDVMRQIDTELIALTDVSAIVSLDALLVIAKQFEDKRVGVINSHYCLLDQQSLGESSYWQYQSQIKFAESKLGSTLGAHGAFYAMRTTLFSPLSADTINDDFIIPMAIVAKGFQAKQNNQLIAIELEASDTAMNWQRRLRIAAGNLQQLLWLKHMLLPKYGGVAFTFASCKALRVIMPILMIITLLGCILLATTHWLYAFLAGAQLLLYTIALLQIFLMKNQQNRLLNMLGYLVSGHAAMFVGAINYLVVHNRTAWKSVVKQ